MTVKKPEIALEVSCGGTFKIATDELACKITVLDHTVGQPAAAAPAVEPSAAVAPEPASAAPVAEPAATVDTFYPTMVQGFCDDVYGRIDAFAGAVQGELSTGGAAVDKMKTLDAALDGMREKIVAGTDELAAAIAAIQAKMVDLRFGLTFLKNHVLFSRRLKEDDAAEITVAKEELLKLLDRVSATFTIAKTVHDEIGVVRKRLTAKDPAAGAILSQVEQLATLPRQLGEAAITLALAREAKEADAAVTVAQARAQAEERLVAIRAAGEAEAEAAEDGLEDQAAVDALLNEAVDVEAASEAGAAEEEMSDEEALKKLAEFGL